MNEFRITERRKAMVRGRMQEILTETVVIPDVDDTHHSGVGVIIIPPNPKAAEVLAKIPKVKVAAEIPIPAPKGKS